MPSLPLRYCSSPIGCSNLTSGGLCPTHSRQRDVRRGSPSKRGYDIVWRRLRLMKLNHDPLCELKTNCPVDQPEPATEVDHRIPISERPDLRLAWDNLQSACHACHSAKTMGEQRGVGCSWQ